MKKLLLIAISLILLVSCSKEPLLKPQPKVDCSDVLVYKHYYWSNVNFVYVYSTQWKKVDGTFYNQDVSGSTYWSSIVGQKRCN
jgi:hypothetical protein